MHSHIRSDVQIFHVYIFETQLQFPKIYYVNKTTKNYLPNNKENMMHITVCKYINVSNLDSLN